MEDIVERCEFWRTGRERIHFIGVGGVGNYSLARMALELGFSVSGSDAVESYLIDDLRSRGAFTYSGSDTATLADADKVVYSLAVPETDVELSLARERKMRLYTRAEYLGEVMRSFGETVAVCGSHGKSTVTAMIGHILSAVGKNPTVSVGAPLSDGLPYKSGGKEHLVLEACEYRDSFLKLYPDIVCATNLELDHTDYFPDLDSIKRSFRHFLCRAERALVINADDENLSSLLPLTDIPTVTVGTSSSSIFRYALNGFSDTGITYSVFKNNIPCGRFKLHLSGVFNVGNATLAIAAADACGVSATDAGRALESFSGIGRRMELVGRVSHSDIIYDYAHHPTEIRAVIDAMKLKYSSLCVIFKPHTYTRTRDLWFDFAAALSLADTVIITDVYPAREKPIEGITAERLAKAVGGNAICAKDGDAAKIALETGCAAIVVMGAGNLDAVLGELLKKDLTK